MTPFDIVFSTRAERDLTEAFKWYESRDIRNAARFRSDALETIERLRETANVYAADETGVRRRRLKRFPYSIHFLIRDSEVVIATIMHHRR